MTFFRWKKITKDHKQVKTSGRARRGKDKELVDQRKFDGMFDLLLYAETKNRCRHIMLEEYLYTEFESPGPCMTSCDNCINVVQLRSIDFSGRVVSLMPLVAELQRRHKTFRASDLADYLQGNYTACFNDVQSATHNRFGMLFLFDKEMVLGLITELIRRKIFKARKSVRYSDWPVTFGNFELELDLPVWNEVNMVSIQMALKIKSNTFIIRYMVYVP